MQLKLIIITYDDPDLADEHIICTLQPGLEERLLQEWQTDNPDAEDTTVCTELLPVNGLHPHE